MASDTGAADAAAAALLDMDVSADDYAKTAATDQAVSSSAARDARTHQSEEDFAHERANYQAKIDNGDIWKQLGTFTPPFSPSSSIRTPSSSNTDAATTVTEEKTLTRKEFILVTAAVGELYWNTDYTLILQICDWAEEGFVLDTKMQESVGRWREKSLAKSEVVGKGKEG